MVYDNAILFTKFQSEKPSFSLPTIHFYTVQSLGEAYTAWLGKDTFELASALVAGNGNEKIVGEIEPVGTVEELIKEYKPQHSLVLIDGDSFQQNPDNTNLLNSSEKVQKHLHDHQDGSKEPINKLLYDAVELGTTLDIDLPNTHSKAAIETLLDVTNSIESKRIDFRSASFYVKRMVMRTSENLRGLLTQAIEVGVKLKNKAKDWGLKENEDPLQRVENLLGNSKVLIMKTGKTNVFGTARDYFVKNLGKLRWEDFPDW